MIISYMNRFRKGTIIKHDYVKNFCKAFQQQQLKVYRKAFAGVFSNWNARCNSNKNFKTYI